jgi:hypothetical protein
MILETSEKIDIRNRIALRDEGRHRFQQGARLGFLVLAGLGMMLLLLSGCGSDSTPKPAASGKKDKVAKSGSNMPEVMPLLSPKEGGTAPPLRQLDKMPVKPPLPGMPPLEELEAKRAAAARTSEKRDPKEIVLPGITREELEAKIEAERARKPTPKGEILPGLTAEQLEAKIKAHREQRAAASSEILPGLTGDQLKAKAAQARQLQETQDTRPEHAFPPK